MYSAFARDVARADDGRLIILVEVVDDLTQRSVDQRSYAGASLEAIKAAVQLDLDARRDRLVRDQSLTAAVVGTLLGSI